MPRDRRLLRRISQGDAEALAELYDSHAPLLALRLRRDGAAVDETQDVLQETFLDVWRTSSSYRGDGAVAAWLWGIARRKYLMLIRSEVRLRHRHEAVLSRSVPVEDEEVWAASLDMEGAIDKLSPDLRGAFIAVAIDGMSVAEAAEMLGAPEGTIKSRVHRARLAMRKDLQ